MEKCKTRGCDNEFVKWTTFQKHCPPCLIAKGRKIEAKTERKEHKEAKERIKSRSDHLREAQTAFNEYIRLRDYNEPCISCGRHHKGQYHAGHYRSVGAAPELRFDCNNVWKQCAPCNNHLSGNAIEYRINLVKRIGLDEVERLEGPTEPKKYTIEEIKEIKAKYSKMARVLEKFNSDQ